ncbi:TrmB family transcriptional regulator [Saliphagus sp. GCM10025308]
MSRADEAVSALQSAGLTEYEARSFVALTRISKGTAKEISQVAEIPRSRVYDTVERLDRRGLVEVQQTDPRTYKAVPIEMAMRRIREDYESHISTAENALKQVEEPESKEEEGMWAITHTDHVVERILMFLDDAEESVHFLVADDDVLDQRVHEHLGRADDRGVRVIVEVPNEDVRDRFSEAVPEDHVVVSPNLASTEAVYSEWPGQLLMVDERAVLAGGITESDLPDVTHEVAVWTYGDDHGFAVWIRELLTDRLRNRDADR